MSDKEEFRIGDIVIRNKDDRYRFRVCNILTINGRAILDVTLNDDARQSFSYYADQCQLAEPRLKSLITW